MKLTSTDRQRALRINRPQREYKGGRKLPIEPFRAFVEDVIAREGADDDREMVNTGFANERLGAIARVACLFAVEERTLLRWRKTATYILEGVADAALTTEGTRHLGDIWPDIYWPGAA